MKYRAYEINKLFYRLYIRKIQIFITNNKKFPLKIIQRLVSVTILFSAILIPNAVFAAVNKLPAPTIGTLLGFYPGGKYSAVSSGGNSSLEPGESVIDYELRVVILDAGERINAPCGTADNGTVIAYVRSSSTPQNSSQFLPLLATWNNPDNSEFRIICAVSQYSIKNSNGVTSYLVSPVAYATILPKPVASVSPTAIPSPTVTPSSLPSITSSNQTVKPKGSKPTISGTPIEGNKFKVSVKSWEMNGNRFEQRSVYLFLCNDPECNDVANSYPVIETGSLDFKVAQTLTMSKAVGKFGQYVKAVDTVYYPAPANSESGEDIPVELSSSIKKIEKANTTSNSSTPSPDLNSQELVNQDLNNTPTVVSSISVSPEMIDKSTTSTIKSPIFLISTLISIAIILLIMVVFILRKKKN